VALKYLADILVIKKKGIMLINDGKRLTTNG